MPTHYIGTKTEVQVLNTWIKLTRAIATIGSKVRPVVENGGLTMSQFGVMEMLFHLGSLPQKDICGKLLFSGGNLVTILDNLERDGFVQRYSNPEDRRSHLVQLTPAGKERIEIVFLAHLKALVKAFASLKSKEKVELERTCKKLGLGDSFQAGKSKS